MGNEPGSGKHDDVLMSTAIGLWITFHEPIYKPTWRVEKKKEKMDEPMNEARI